ALEDLGPVSDVPRDPWWLLTLCYLSWGVSEVGDLERAQTLYDLLTPYAGRCATMGVNILGPVSRFLALLATTLGRGAEARAHFDAALEMNERLGGRPTLARTQLDYARLLFREEAVAERHAALRLCIAAIETAQQLGMK